LLACAGGIFAAVSFGSAGNTGCKRSEKIEPTGAMTRVLHGLSVGAARRRNSGGPSPFGAFVRDRVRRPSGSSAVAKGARGRMRQIAGPVLRPGSPGDRRAGSRRGGGSPSTRSRRPSHRQQGSTGHPRDRSAVHRSGRNLQGDCGGAGPSWFSFRLLRWRAGRRTPLGATTNVSANTTHVRGSTGRPPDEWGGARGGRRTPSRVPLQFRISGRPDQRFLTGQPQRPPEGGVARAGRTSRSFGPTWLDYLTRHA